MITAGAGRRHGVDAGTCRQSAGRQFPAAVADTVGAGDAFMSGLLDALARRGLLAPASLAALGDAATLASILDDASLVAGIAISRPGADPPRRAEVDALRCMRLGSRARRRPPAVVQVGAGDHVSLAREDPLGQEVMHAGLGVGAEVGDDEDAVVAVVGVADGGQQDAAGAEPGQQQGVDAALAQLVIEVGGREGADPGLANHACRRARGAIRSSMAVDGESAWKARPAAATLVPIMLVGGIGVVVSVLESDPDDSRSGRHGLADEIDRLGRRAARSSIRRR